MEPLLKRISFIAGYFLLLAASPLLYGAGAWNGIAITAWNGSAVTAWNGVNVIGGGGGGGGTNPTTANLVAWWNLEDANDAHSGAHNLTTSGSPTFVSSGGISNSMLVDASEAIFQADAGWLTLTGSHSFCLWFKPSGTPAAFKGLFAQYGTSAANQSWEVGIGTDSKVEFGVGNGTSTKTTTSTTALSNGSWYFIVGVFTSATSIKIYINGVLEATNSTSIPTNIQDGASDFFIGTYHATSNAGQGHYDSVAIFSKVLSQSEIDWLYNSGAGRAYSAL